MNMGCQKLTGSTPPHSRIKAPAIRVYAVPLAQAPGISARMYVCDLVLVVFEGSLVSGRRGFMRAA